MFKLLSRKLLGKNFSNIYKTVIIAAVIGFGLSSMDIKIQLAQSVLILTSIMYSGTVVLRTLSSKDNVRTIKGIFAMPYDNKKTLWEYTAVVGIYTIFTKTTLLISLLFALTKFTILYCVLFLLGTIYAVIGGMCAFACLRRTPLVSVLFAVVGASMAFFLPKGYIAAVVLATADIAAAIILSAQPFESFYVKENTFIKPKARKGKPKMIIPKYIVRYFLTNKNFIVSIMMSLVFSCFLAKMFDSQNIEFGFGAALAMISTNTPLATIVSSNRSLKKKLDVIPNKTVGFFVPYSIMSFIIYAVSYALFIIAYAILGGTLEFKWIITAVLFSVQCAVFVSILENKYTLTKWNTEPDLWHHPRKYIIPGVLLLESMIVNSI